MTMCTVLCQFLLSYNCASRFPPVSLPPPPAQLSYSFPSVPSSSLRSPYHFHMTPSEAGLPRATMATIRHFGWQRVAVITENKPVFTAGTLRTKSVCVSTYIPRITQLVFCLKTAALLVVFAISSQTVVFQPDRLSS